MPNIEIDGAIHEVDGGQNLLQACLALGLDLPYFCWHPAMGSVGACRQCVVTQYTGPEDRRGRLVVGCMTPVGEGLRISLKNDAAKEFRADIIELLMTNHPHDCPVCEEGGQCHLQDMTVMTGHTVRRFRGKKRTHRNQYLGPFINHEMNRCIACYRCVRYYQDYAGGKDLGVFGAHHHVYFGRSEDGVLENEFSGNLVEVCPTGVFTDKTYGKRYSRKWDLQTAPSICVHCSLGCNTTPGERYGELRSIVNRYHGEINRYFLCDRGRFGYGFVNSERRILQPELRGRQAISPDAARELLKSVLEPAEKVIGIGSPRASLEANYALRELVGADRFYTGWTESGNELMQTVLEVLRRTDALNPTLAQIEQADAVLILGEDPSNTAPRLALSVRQAVRNAGFELAAKVGIPHWQDDAVREVAQDLRSPLFIASCASTRLDGIATDVFRGTPDEIACLGFAVARNLNPKAPAVRNLSASLKDKARVIADALKNAQRPLVISGTGCLDKTVIEAAANVAKALQSGGKALSLVVPECNSTGLALLSGHSLEEAEKALESGAAETVLIVENDLYRHAGKSLVDRLLDRAKYVVLIDHSRHPIAGKADLVLPAASFAETEGTYVNNEGRAQRFFSVMLPGAEMQDSWQWLRDAGAGNWEHADSIIAAIASGIPGLKGVADAAPGAGFRISGMKIPRQSQRYSGRTAMRANIAVSEPKQPVDPDSPLAFSMEGAAVQPPAALMSSAWAPAWNSNQSIIKFQAEVGGHLQGGDPGVRLLESSGSLDWFAAFPEPAKAAKGTWLVVPQYYIFGSEPLSSGSPAIAEQVNGLCVLLNPEDLDALQTKSGDALELQFDGQSTVAEAKSDIGVPIGVAAVSFGLAGSEGIDWLTRVPIRKAAAEV
ncbi:MAG: NADH-quinone oxidoreductase subunit NuoG [Methylococcaceae bacterium]|nr:NADH-quinone oxidoreductase subunit NuoG [Methylococcaceae bacterium]